MSTEQIAQNTDIQRSGLCVTWCSDTDEVRAAQHLRYRVFGLEMGATLPTAADSLDIDEYDSWCDHLVVKLGDEKVIGTYRVLRPERAAELGKIYSDSEFDLSPLSHLRGRMIEVGRSCVDPNYRSGSVIMTLWTELAKFMSRNGYDHVVGCASVPIDDGGQMANKIYQKFLTSGVMSSQFKVYPVKPLPLWSDLEDGSSDLPPLLKGYLRLGAKICGAPALDTQFNTADFLTLLSIQDIQPRYARHFLTEKKYLNF